MDSRETTADDSSFVVLGLGSMPPSSIQGNALSSDQQSLDSMISYDSAGCNLQKQLDLLLHENLTLKDSLNQNNLAMKTQFKALSKWQEEVSDAHRINKQKFEETKALVKLLRAENVALKSGSGRHLANDSQSEINGLQRQIDLLKAEKLILVKDRDSFREECTKMNCKVSNMEWAVRKASEELETLRKSRKSEDSHESMQSWMCYDEPQGRHPLSIEVDYPPVPDVQLVGKEKQALAIAEYSNKMQELQTIYESKYAEQKTVQEICNRKIEELIRNLEKMDDTLNAKEALLKTTVSELLLEKDKNQQLQTQCEKLAVLQNQVEVYETDYKEERVAREKLVNEKEDMATELRCLRAKISDLEARSNAIPTLSLDASSMTPEEGILPSSQAPAENLESHIQANSFSCPLCLMKFGDVRECEEHVNECLDLHMRP